MSQESKKAAQLTRVRLVEAAFYLERAVESASKVGDKDLVSKVKANKEAVEKTRKDPSDKLGEVKVDPS